MARHYYQTPEPPALSRRILGLMTETLPTSPTPDALTQQRAEFWVKALHDLAQPVQALALFAERLRRQDLGPQAAPVVDQVGAGVQELQRALQSLAQVAQRDAGHGVDQAQPGPVDSLPALVRGDAATQTLPPTEGPPPDRC